MSDRFTDSIDPLALATQGRSIEGKIALAALKRVLSLVRSSSGDVVFSLEFDTDEAGIARIRGSVETTLILQCQRCMEEMSYPVLSKVRLGIVPTREAAEQLPDNYEPLVCDDETTVVSLLEDEIILALPIVAMHRIDECPQGDALLKQMNEQEEGSQGDVSAGRENPFAVLAQLKSDSTEDSEDKAE